MKVAPGYTACCNASPVWRGISDAKLLWSARWSRVGTPHRCAAVDVHASAYYNH